MDHSVFEMENMANVLRVGPSYIQQPDVWLWYDNKNALSASSYLDIQQKKNSLTPTKLTSI